MSLRTIGPTDAAFEECLQGFQNDVATATRCFYAMETINHLASQDTVLLQKLNEAPEFWNLVQGSNQNSLFITLGRIFGQEKDAQFTLDKIFGLAEAGGGAIFSKDRLADRKRHDSTTADEWLPDYLKTAYVPLPKNFRAWKKIRNLFRRKFEATYRPIRHEIYAHSIASEERKVQLFAETRIADLQRTIRFLIRVSDGLRQLYNNGRNPMVGPFAPTSVSHVVTRTSTERSASDQEVIFKATQKVMEQVKQS
ncbi:hypothetical protein [Falsiroseomonas sp.]|uniref:AbiU2 domain-containing protein n=1 Tax=Falsiroseomonas sp. TaxID=2870721 RepID=UPI00271DECB5|nr:hypothetical protein [Falsiroseomonas sp.]MDO9502114.1 hypothetical protein [Falsiroseomonas sp.]